MATLSTPRGPRRALVDPNRAPPGTVAPTFGAGLAVGDGAVVSVDFGAGAAQVPTGTKVPGTIPVDTRGAADGDLLGYDAGEGAFVATTSPGAVTREALDTETTASTPVASLTVGAGRTVVVDVSLVGIRDDAGAGRAFEGAFAVRRPAAGDVVLLEELVLVLGDAGEVAVSCAGDEVSLSVTPPSTDLWHWEATLVAREVVA